MTVTLPIIFHTDGTSQLKDLGIEYKLDDCQQKQMTFFNIAAIADYVEEGTDNQYTSIFAGGFEFICPLTQQYVIDKIKSND